jgi:salicylate hydroxylase
MTRPVPAVHDDPSSHPKQTCRTCDGEVLIVGGGIAGLAAALALARSGIASHVLEQRQEPAEEGAGIQIGPNGTRILAALGVATILAPHVGIPTAIAVHDGLTGRELTRLPLGKWIAERHGAPYWVAHRGDLHAALLERANAEPLVRITMNFSVTNSTETDGDATALTVDKRRASGIALIGADGLWSRVRSEHFDTSSPQPIGRSAARAILPADDVPNAFRESVTGVWMAPDVHIVHYPVRANSEIAIVVIYSNKRTNLGWGTSVRPVVVHEQVARFAEPIRGLIRGICQWRQWSLFSRNPLHHWTKGRIALMGDAAHPVLPYLAQGAVLALEDAEALAAKLACDPNDLAAALRSYEVSRRRRTMRVAAASRRNGQLYHLSGALAMARDIALRILPGDRLMASYDWLYDWHG